MDGSFIFGKTLQIDFLLIERGRHKSVRFLLIHLRDIPCGDTLAAVRAKNRPMILGKVNRAVDNPVVIHLDKIALPDLLIVGDETFTIDTVNL